MKMYLRLDVRSQIQTGQTTGNVGIYNQMTNQKTHRRRQFWKTKLQDHP